MFYLTITIHPAYVYGVVLSGEFKSAVINMTIFSVSIHVERVAGDISFL